jgi:molybdate transport system substrate-binding protein
MLGLIGRLTVAVAAVATLLASAPASAGDLVVFSDGPLKPALDKIAMRFQAKSSHQVGIVYGPSPVLKAKLAAGEAADILISLTADIDAMAADGKLVAIGQGVARIKLGLAVRSGVPRPGIATLDAFTQALLRADAVIHNNVASGLAFARQLDRIGIAEQLKPKMVVIGPVPGVLVELTKRSGNEVGIGQMSQIIEADGQGIDMVGPLPPEVQSEITYAAGIFPATKSMTAAKEFVAFLGSPEANALLIIAGAK